jgi:outer membrane protein assembly factor BamB
LTDNGGYREGPTAGSVFRIRTGLIVSALVLLLAVTACSRVSNPTGWPGGVVSGDAILIGSRDGELIALDLETGTSLWRQELPREDDPQAIYGTPAVFDGTVLAGGYDGLLYAFDVLDGSPQWTEQVGEEGFPIVGAPLVSGDTVLVGSSDGNFYALSAKDGSEIWRFPTGNKIWSTPAVADGVVYFGSLDKFVYALRIADGSELWQFPAGGAVTAAPVVAGGRVYFGAFDGNFYAVDAQTGLEVWRFDETGGWFWASAVATETAIYAPNMDGHLYALDLRTGSLLWDLETDGSIVSSPVIVDDKIAVASDDGRLRIARLADGFTVGQCNIGGKLRTPLAESDGVVFFGADDNSIRALSIKASGNPDEKWRPFFTDKEDQSAAGPPAAC